MHVAQFTLHAKPGHYEQVAEITPSSPPASSAIIRHSRRC